MKRTERKKTQKKEVEHNTTAHHLLVIGDSQ